MACALLMVNNTRDILTDADVGENTLAVRTGGKQARRASATLLTVPIIAPLTLIRDLDLWVALAAASTSLLV